MTNEALICNLCDSPGTLERAAESASIGCNVRRFSNETFTVWRCPNCNSLHCREAVDLDAYYVDYPMRQQRVDFAAIQAFKNRLKIMQRHGLMPSHRILDYGSGTALFVEFLKQNGFDAVGYDPYVPAVSDRSVLDSQFDFVISQDVIEHDDDPSHSLKEHVRRLKPGGILCIGTPNASEIELTDDYSMELHMPYHRHILSEVSLLGLARQEGLESLAVYHRFYYDTLFPMVNTQFIKRYVRKAGGMLDAGFEPPRIGMVLTSPELLFFGLFGYLFRARGNMLAIFQR
jgi:2-polyprenyl-3-methyl-5-hydroxy-6-metoxy-1,4-benzoquinol methylase